MTTNNDKVNAARWREAFKEIGLIKDRIVELQDVCLNLEFAIHRIERLQDTIPMKNEGFIDHQGRSIAIVDVEEFLRREAAKDAAIRQVEVMEQETSGEENAEDSGAGREEAGGESQQAEAEAAVQGKKRGRPRRDRGEHPAGQDAGGADNG